MKNEKVKITDKAVLEKALKLKDLLFAVVAVIVCLLNLWLASKLSPLAQDIAINRQRVLANEVVVRDIEKNTSEELKYLRGRIDEVYNLVNR